MSSRVFISDNLAGEAMPQFTYARDYPYDIGLIELAHNCAKAARFEHGEKLGETGKET